MTSIAYQVALEIASHEAIVRQAYKDSKGVWTWSIGLTNGTGHNVERYIGKPQPLRHCLAIFVWALRRYAEDVEEAFAPKVLTREQFAAALSFHWNTGAIKRASWVKQWKAGQVQQAKISIMDWTKDKELVGRRTKERDLFFSGKWSNRGTMTEFTRLTSRHTVDWKSGKKINVERELLEALGHTPPPPERPFPEVKELPPAPQIVPPQTGFWAFISRLLGWS